MTTTEELQDMEGQTAVDVNGAKLGKIGQIYVDDRTGQPLWVTITTGMFGTKQSFAPLHGSRPDGGDLHLAVTKDMVTDAPGVEADGHIEDSENEALYTYYDGYLGGRDGIQGHDTSGPTTDGAMTRSEERLHVGTEQADAGRARLRKHVVTENVTQTVPVSHEEVRLVREPVQPGDTADPAIEEAATDVTLTEERVVVNKETVPVEKVRLGTETVTEQQDVTEAVRKEEIEFDDDSGTTRTDDVDDVDRVPPSR